MAEETLSKEIILSNQIRKFERELIAKQHKIDEATGTISFPEFEILLRPTPEPKLEGNTNGDLLNYALALRKALQAANVDKTTTKEILDPILANVTKSYELHKQNGQTIESIAVEGIHKDYQEHNQSSLFQYSSPLAVFFVLALVVLTFIFITKAKKQLAKKDARIAELEASNPGSAIITRTQAATEAKQEKVLEGWQAAFKIMIPVILQCRTDGPKKRTKTELKALCFKHGGELSDAQLEFLRELLGSDHVNTNGGATVQG